MEIRALAEQVLFSDQLDAKLVPATVLTDEAPGKAIRVPEAPVRPALLRIKKGGEMVQFPKVHELEREEPRARLLHFFANHELLATELMALVLLRFPDAPKAFRRGVAKTLMEEQVHTQLYRERMSELGVEFGAYPVTGYFWDALKGMESPLDYVTGLPLTFEQANLDFSKYFSSLFAKIQDEKSEALMERIYRDEIRHVAYGLKWFRDWKSPQRSDWEAYRAQLRFPLSPRRAKGAVFNIEGRQRSGFDEPFIHALAVYSKSRGRCPDVYYFNPTAEWEFAVGAGFTPTKQQIALQKDLETLPQFLGSEDDVVLVSSEPRTEFLVSLNQVGMPIPEFEVLADGGVGRDSDLLHRTLGELRPWAWSPSSRRVYQSTTGAAPGSLKWGRATGHQQKGEDGRSLFSKATGVCQLGQLLEAEANPDWLCSLAEVGRIVSTVDEAFALIASWRAQGIDRFVAKAKYGAAGSRMLRLWEDPVSSAQVKWMEKVLNTDGELVLEPWHERVLDFSAHFDVSGDGVRFVGFVRMLNDHRGQFLAATVASHLTSGLKPEIPRFMHGPEGDRFKRLYERVGLKTLEACQALDYRGPVGIDAYLFRDRAGGLRLKPIVELNPRYTMGRMTLALRRHVAPGRTVTLLLLSPVQLRQLGLQSFSEVPALLHERFPREMTKDTVSRLSQGALCLTDPARATQCLAVLLVGTEGRGWVDQMVRGGASA